MAKENKKGGQDEDLRTNLNQQDNEGNEGVNALSPEEYLQQEEGGNINEASFPDNDLPPISAAPEMAAGQEEQPKKKDKTPSGQKPLGKQGKKDEEISSGEEAADSDAPQVAAKGNKGKLLTTDGLEYD